MSSTYIPAALRREVIQRAAGCCEYCHIGEEDRAIDYAIDHVIAEKHGGITTNENLCLTCYWCNSYKGSDLSSVDWEGGGAIVPLYNPRQQIWTEHFRLEEARLFGITPAGRVTISLLRLNAPERLEERHLLMMLGVYPCGL